jgi:acyl-CoA reductase-like NAD-dependent aldehyde dehydrogenase
MSKTFKTYNPYDDSLVGEFEFHDQAYVNNVLDKLEQGRKVQRTLTAHDRAEILSKAAELLDKYGEELAHLVTKEVGKTIGDSRVEMHRAKNTLLASSIEARNITGEVLDSDSYTPLRKKIGIITRQPIGTILCITPFNFPINLSVHKIGPAFAAGNTIFFKPGPQNYQSGKRLVELFYEAGMPEECIQFCFPDIPELEKVVASDRIHCISFTGGTRTADAIAKNAGRKKLLLELGGNDPLIVMPDVEHLEVAVETAIAQRFGTAGQRCTASKRVFLHEEVYDDFKKMLVEKTENLTIGDPTDEKTFIGPVVNKAAADVIEKRIHDAIADGATCLAGNKREGNIIHPTVLENVNLKSELIADETFGPVIPIVKFNDIDELIEMINNQPYGLQAGCFTNNIRVIEKLFEELEVGALAINDGSGFRAEHFPFGGVKNSGLGREGVKYAMEEMSIIKSLII